MANGFNRNLRGLLSSPAANLGIGLLAAGGPSLQPTSLGQGLARATQFASERERQQLRNEQMRQELRQRKRQQQAQQQLQGLLGSTEMVRGPGSQPTGIDGEPLGNIPGRLAEVSAMATTEGRQQAMSLLSEAAPQQFAQQMTSGLLGQMFPGPERAEPAPVRIARFLSDPNEDPKAKEELRKQLESRGMDEQFAQILKGLQVQQLQRQLEVAEEEDERNKARAKMSVLNADDALNEAAKINLRLQGTLGETGIGLNDIRQRIAGPVTALKLNRVFGISDDVARQIAADLEAFEQITTREGLRSLFEGQIGEGNVTNARLETYFNTKPGVDKLPETNARAIARMMEDNLQSADLLELEIPTRSQTERLIEMQRQFAEGNMETGNDQRIDLGNGVFLEWVE